MRPVRIILDQLDYDYLCLRADLVNAQPSHFIASIIREWIHKQEGADIETTTEKTTAAESDH